MNANKTYTIEDYQNVMKLLNKGISFRNISEITKSTEELHGCGLKA